MRPLFGQPQPDGESTEIKDHREGNNGIVSNQPTKQNQEQVTDSESAGIESTNLKDQKPELSSIAEKLNKEAITLQKLAKNTPNPAIKATIMSKSLRLEALHAQALMYLSAGIAVPDWKLERIRNERNKVYAENEEDEKNTAITAIPTIVKAAERLSRSNNKTFEDNVTSIIEPQKEGHQSSLGKTLIEAKKLIGEIELKKFLRKQGIPEDELSSYVKKLDFRLIQELLGNNSVIPEDLELLLFNDNKQTEPTEDLLDSEQLQDPSQIIDMFRSEIKRVSQIMESDKLSDIRIRTSIATTVLDRMIATQQIDLVTSDVVDNLFEELNLLPQISHTTETASTTTEDLPSDTQVKEQKVLPKKYEDANIACMAYKRIIAQRQLEEKQLLLGSLSLLKKGDEEFQAKKSSLERQISSAQTTEEKIGLIENFISSADTEGQAGSVEALRDYFISDITQNLSALREEKNENSPPIELIGTIQLMRDRGYYVLVVDNKEDFKKLTLADDDTIGAAYKKGRLYLICSDGYDLEHEAIELPSYKTIPALRDVAEHEISHLQDDDEQRVKAEYTTTFTTQKIMNLLANKLPNMPEGEYDKFFDFISRTLQESYEQGQATSQTLLTILQRIGITEDDKTLKLKLENLLLYYENTINEITAPENDLSKKSRQVQELRAEMSNKLQVLGSKLTLDAIGIGGGDAFLTIEETEKEPLYHSHNIEAVNTIRIINSLLSNFDSSNTDLEQRAELTKKLQEKLAGYQEFNTTNTLTLLLSILNDEGIDSKSLFNLNQSEDDLTTNDTEEAYIKHTKRFVYGAFKYQVLSLIKEGELILKPGETIDNKIEEVYKIYKLFVRQGFDLTDIKSNRPNKRLVGNKLFSFTSRADVNALLAVHHSEGRDVNPWNVHGNTQHPLDLLLSPRPIGWASDALGYTTKDIAEMGGLVRRVRDPKTGRWTIRSGKDASLMPVDYMKRLPLGLHTVPFIANLYSNYLESRGIDASKESITSTNYRERTGESMLDMNTPDIIRLIVKSFSKRLTESNNYPDPNQVYKLLEQAGLVYFEGGQITTALYGLNRRKDEYLARHLYTQTNENGELIPGTKSTILYQNLVNRGYSGRDLHLLMEAYNENQILIDTTGKEITINSREYPIMLGTVTARLAERLKMMRSGGSQASKNEDNLNSYIAQGNRFDEISRAIMQLQYESYQQLDSASNSSDIFTIYDVIKALEYVDTIAPNDRSLGTDTIEGWKNVKSSVTFGRGDSQFTFSREDLKEYICCFFYAREYEATALGIFGEEQVIRLPGTDGTDIYLSITDGSSIIDEEQKKQWVYSFVQRWNQAPKLAEKSWNEQKPTRGWDTLSEIEKSLYISMEHENLKVEFMRNGIFSIRNMQEDEIPEPYRINNISDTENSEELLRWKNEYGSLLTYKQPGKNILIKLPGYPQPQRIKAVEGLDKKAITYEFGEFVHSDGAEDPNAYSLKDISGKLINSVEDIKYEKSQVSAMYFYLQYLLQLANNSRDEAGRNKDIWVGRAQTAMWLRWIHTALTIGALVAFPPALAGLFLNPLMILSLLANYFIVGNWITMKANLWGERKNQYIQAGLKLAEMEPTFEQAYFQEDFSLGPARLRLLQMLKTAEDIMKRAVVHTTKTPKNILQKQTENAVDTFKQTLPSIS